MGRRNRRVSWKILPIGDNRLQDKESIEKEEAKVTIHPHIRQPERLPIQTFPPYEINENEEEDSPSPDKDITGDGDFYGYQLTDCQWPTGYPTECIQPVIQWPPHAFPYQQLLPNIPPESAVFPDCCRLTSTHPYYPYFGMANPRYNQWSDPRVTDDARLYHALTTPSLAGSWVVNDSSYKLSSYPVEAEEPADPGNPVKFMDYPSAPYVYPGYVMFGPSIASRNRTGELNQPRRSVEGTTYHSATADVWTKKRRRRRKPGRGQGNQKTATDEAPSIQVQELDNALPQLLETEASLDRDKIQTQTANEAASSDPLCTEEISSPQPEETQESIARNVFEEAASEITSPQISATSSINSVSEEGDHENVRFLVDTVPLCSTFGEVTTVSGQKHEDNIDVDESDHNSRWEDTSLDQEQDQDLSVEHQSDIATFEEMQKRTPDADGIADNPTVDDHSSDNKELDDSRVSSPEKFSRCSSLESVDFNSIEMRPWYLDTMNKFQEACGSETSETEDDESESSDDNWSDDGRQHFLPDPDNFGDQVVDREDEYGVFNAVVSVVETVTRPISGRVNSIEHMVDLLIVEAAQEIYSEDISSENVSYPFSELCTNALAGKNDYIGSIEEDVYQTAFSNLRTHSDLIIGEEFSQDIVTGSCDEKEETADEFVVHENNICSNEEPISQRILAFSEQEEPKKPKFHELKLFAKSQDSPLEQKTKIHDIMQLSLDGLYSEETERCISLVAEDDELSKRSDVSSTSQRSTENVVQETCINLMESRQTEAPIDDAELSENCDLSSISKQDSVLDSSVNTTERMRINASLFRDVELSKEFSTAQKDCMLESLVNDLQNGQTVAITLDVELPKDNDLSSKSQKVNRPVSSVYTTRSGQTQATILEDVALTENCDHFSSSQEDRIPELCANFSEGRQTEASIFEDVKFSEDSSTCQQDCVLESPVNDMESRRTEGDVELPKESSTSQQGCILESLVSYMESTQTAAIIPDVELSKDKYLSSTSQQVSLPESSVNAIEIRQTEEHIELSEHCDLTATYQHEFVQKSSEKVREGGETEEYIFKDAEFLTNFYLSSTSQEVTEILSIELPSAEDENTSLLQSELQDIDISHDDDEAASLCADWDDTKALEHALLELEELREQGNNFDDTFLESDTSSDILVSYTSRENCSKYYQLCSSLDADEEDEGEACFDPLYPEAVAVVEPIEKPEVTHDQSELVLEEVTSSETNPESLHTDVVMLESSSPICGKLTLGEHLRNVGGDTEASQSECGSEDVELISHRYEIPESCSLRRNWSGNKASIAVELLQSESQSVCQSRSRDGSEHRHERSRAMDEWAREDSGVQSEESADDDDTDLAPCPIRALSNLIRDDDEEDVFCKGSLPGHQERPTQEKKIPLAAYIKANIPMSDKPVCCSIT